MSTQTRIHRTYTIEIDGHTFPIPFNDETGTIDDTATLYISADGTRALITALCQDDSPTDPLEDHDGEFIQFDRRYTHDGPRPEPEDFKRLIRSNPGRVFTVSYCSSNHGPGTASCSVDVGPFTVADTYNHKAKIESYGAGIRRIVDGYTSTAEQAIDSTNGYYIIPEDVPPERRRDYANAVLEEYAKWCNGEVYGLIRWTFTLDGDIWELDEDGRDGEVWGFIGYEYAEQSLADELQYYFDKLEVTP